MQNFNLHSHTRRCRHADFNMSDEDYLKEYISTGFKKMAYTDHCPEKNPIDKRPRMRMDFSEKDEYISSINKLRNKYSDKIEVLSGFEVEFLPGEEKNITDLKKDSDILILGQHFVIGDDGDLKIFGADTLNENDVLKYAEYVCRAMELGIPDIIAHPDIFMSPSGNFPDARNYAAHAVCRAAEKYHVPLEINLNNIFFNTYFTSGRLNSDNISKQKTKLGAVKYPSKNFWNIACKYDIKAVYGIDAHYRGQILLWTKLRQLADIVLGNEIIGRLHFLNEWP